MDPRRSLPSVERVIGQLDGLPHDLLAGAARDAVAAARAAIDRAAIDSAAIDGVVIDDEAGPTEADVLADAQARVAAMRTRLLQPVVNATGVL
ncbi:MAG: hypothetical protein ABIP21_07575, partial [Acidimicrobiia bacterium]